MNRETTPLGELIQQYRNKANMTQTELASKIHITKGGLSKIETGEVKKPELKTMQCIASVLNIPFHEYVVLYIELEQKSESLMGILEIAITTSENTSIAPKIATKFLETEKEDSLELVERLYSTTASITDTAIQLDLYNSIIDYSRSHGIMPYIAQGMYQKYMIKRNDFTKLNETYHLGEKVLDYVQFLSDRDKIKFYYCLAVHACVLMNYEYSIKLSNYVIENDTLQSEFKGEYKALAIHNVCFALYFLGRYNESKEQLEKYKKFEFSYITDNYNFFTALLSSKTESTDSALHQLNSYLKYSSEYNLVYVVCELMNIYYDSNDFNSAMDLLKYETRMIESLNDERIRPSRRVKFANFYRQVGTILLKKNDVEMAFEYHRNSALEYAKVGMYDDALASVTLINEALIEDFSRVSVDVLRNINTLYLRIINKKY
ncbi:helix-turn-helix domain-containing protein [Paenibacillus sp. 481]|uniref:helix-turn-helix domain-containing protein n=1 Tax=Paenibacillus sp. 481 TaxID=2835869 RepID=UPI001E441B63|nr:helix-turn-helix transcriptional regulator [Paenibacillus sp. 481]UHA72055.1 helix-turn-helix transcriptional regulator [Paenibacillus sp. 481]